jgi:hypothetical protein
LVQESKKPPPHESDRAAGIFVELFCMGESQNLTRKSKYRSYHPIRCHPTRRILLAIILVASYLSRPTPLHTRSVKQYCPHLAGDDRGDGYDMYLYWIPECGSIYRYTLDIKNKTGFCYVLARVIEVVAVITLPS